jgi:hypothetical protein
VISTRRNRGVSSTVAILALPAGSVPVLDPARQLNDDLRLDAREFVTRVTPEKGIVVRAESVVDCAPVVLLQLLAREHEHVVLFLLDVAPQIASVVRLTRVSDFA